MTQQESSNPFSSPLRIRRMLTNTPPALHHVLPGLLQGTVGMVAASGGTGKSTFLLQLAFALASGASVCGGLFSDVAPECARKSEPVKVVYVAAEESETLLWHRMHAVVSHLFETDYPHLEQAEREELLNLFEQNVILFPLQGKSRTLLLDEAQQPTEAFWQLVHACQGASLVLIDPVRQFHCGDENETWNMTAFVQTMQILATRTRAAVLLAHHTNRASTLTGTGDTAGAARGSTALTDGVRWQLNLSRIGPDLMRQYGISSREEKLYIRADISKSNYLAPYPTQVLRRAGGGALSLVHAPCGVVKAKAMTAPSSKSYPRRTVKVGPA